MKKNYQQQKQKLKKQEEEEEGKEDEAEAAARAGPQCRFKSRHVRYVIFAGRSARKLQL